MYKGEFKFNIEDAFNGDNQYGMTFAVSNEDLGQEMQIAPPVGKRVLTVAASGDQPLMYAAYGAGHIDTFDITFNARAIMDFKTAALPIADFQEYKHAIRCIVSNKIRNTISSDDPSRNMFERIIRRMPDDTGALMDKYSHGFAFPYLYDRPNYRNNPLCNAQTYHIIQKTVTKPFNFIWASLYNLHKFLDMEYDIMNLSNIFGWYSEMYDDPTARAIETLHSLWPYLAPGGKIVACSGGIIKHRRIAQLESIFNGAAKIEKFNGAWLPCVITKVR